MIHVLGLEFDEEYNGEVRFMISLFLKTLRAFKFPCLPLHKVLNVGPLPCQTSVQSIHPVVHSPDKNRRHRCLAQKGAHIEHLM